MCSVDQDHYFGRWIGFRLGRRLRRRHPRKIGRDAMRSIMHGRVAHRIARQEGGQKPSRLAVGVPGAQLSNRRSSGVHWSGSSSARGDCETSTKPQWFRRAHTDPLRVDGNGPKQSLDFACPAGSQASELQGVPRTREPNRSDLHRCTFVEGKPKFRRRDNFCRASAESLRIASMSNFARRRSSVSSPSLNLP
jgi:hypothetical protein